MKWLTSYNIYNFLCVYMPLLYIYSSFVPGVDWGTAIVLLCIPLFLGETKRNNESAPSTLWAIIVYSTLCSLINLATGMYYSEPTAIIMRTGRFAVVMFVMFYWGSSKLFVPEKYIKLLRGLSLFVAAYAILQTIVYKLTGIQLINVIGNVNSDLSILSDNGLQYRPPSIFLEPSHVCYFLTPYLCFLLFFTQHTNDKKSKKKLFEAMIISLGMLFTTSGQGLIVLAVCWIIWFFRSVKNMNILDIAIFAALLLFLVKNFDFNSTINRITTTDDLNAVDARKIGYTLLNNLTATQRFFGTGFGNYNDNVYYSSFAEILFCTGYVGLFLVVLLLLKPFFKGLLFQKVLVVSCFILMLGGGIYTASYLCLYLPFLFYCDWGNSSYAK